MSPDGALEVTTDFSSIDLSDLVMDFGSSWNPVPADGTFGASRLPDSLLPSFSLDDKPFPDWAFTTDPAALASASASGSSSLSTPMSADSYLLPVAELQLLRAFLRVATRLNVGPSVWELTALSPFCLPASADPGALPPPPSDLPPSWRPTPGQLQIPHHPLFDLLPWPTARERIIRIMSLPESVRPAAAAGPLALVEFAYDMEDGAEGLRVWGADPCDPGGWEVGQKVFERWWFIFDRDIVEQSNRWRETRGAARLSLNGVDMCGGGSAGGPWV